MIQLKQIPDFLLKEIEDRYVQENFYRLKLYFRDLNLKAYIDDKIAQFQQTIQTGLVATEAPKLIQRFNTDAGTLPGHLVRINAANTVVKITTNAVATIPNGVFGVGYAKPSATLIDVIFSGIKDGYAGFTTGMPLFVSTGGVPTHSVPATGVSQQIGWAVDTDKMFVSFLQPMKRA